jgi:hypothetical protein
MSFGYQILGFGGVATAPSYVTLGVVFDGTNDYMSRGADWTGNADSTQGILSLWFRINAGDDSNRRYMAAPGGLFVIDQASSNKFVWALYDSAASKVIVFGSSTAYTASSTWRHLLVSFDTNYSAGNKKTYLYITDTEDNLIVADGHTAFTVDLTASDQFIGASADSSAKFNGDMADFYWAPGQFLDFSVTANRRKFIDAEGKPVNLGSDGSTPTGTAPIAFFHVGAGGAAVDFDNNLGSGGDVTITGALALASTNPSD